MRKNKIVFIALFGLLSCNESKSVDTDNIVPIENIVPGPVVHESLTDKQLEDVTFIHETFIEVNPVSLEETITNFKRDRNPDNEIQIWLSMADAYIPFVHKREGKENFGARNEAFSLLLMRSMMSTEDVILNSDLKILSEEEVQTLLNSYTLDPAPLIVGES